MHKKGSQRLPVSNLVSAAFGCAFLLGSLLMSSVFSFAPVDARVTGQTAGAVGVPGLRPPASSRSYAGSRTRGTRRAVARTVSRSIKSKQVTSKRSIRKGKGARASRGGKAARVSHARPAARAIPPQNLIDKMSSHTLAPGVVHKFVRSPLTINLVDVDMGKAPVKVRAVLAGDSFNRLKDVEDHARETHAIAAVNANYFKTDGTPLGTLKIDGEWVSGPIFDRVSLGITKSGFVRIDRLNLHGVLTTSRPEVPTIWVNNINQPRRTGSRLVAYTRRWGSTVKLPYEGALVAVSPQGEIVDKSTRYMEIPWGGYVLSDSKGGAISKLERGDRVYMSWKTNPSSWNDVVQSVSGGPMLLRAGKIVMDLKAEHFRSGWTSASITHRTACGVTGDNHLILVTVEGPHTLWDLAKFFHKLGCTEAMNLDGGGSTTMVVNGATVTRNAKTTQRRVASTLAVFDLNAAAVQERCLNCSYRPHVNLTDFATAENTLCDSLVEDGLAMDGLLGMSTADINRVLAQEAQQTTMTVVPDDIDLGTSEISPFNEGGNLDKSNDSKSGRAQIHSQKKQHSKWNRKLRESEIPDQDLRGKKSHGRKDASVPDGHDVIHNTDSWTGKLFKRVPKFRLLP